MRFFFLLDITFISNHLKPFALGIRAGDEVTILPLLTYVLAFTEKEWK